jgi:hypothetical protein
MISSALSGEGDRIMNVFIFPSLLIALDMGAAIVYLFVGDWRRGVYWIAAAVLTACVTI